MAFEIFLEKFPKGNDCRPLDEDKIKPYEGIVPESLLEFWRHHGIGKYGEGMIEIIDPEQYRGALETWLAKEVPNYVPIAISNFGDLYYYRKLSEEAEDVSALDPCYARISVTVWSLMSFFDKFLVEDDYYNNTLRRELFLQAVKKHGPLKQGDIYIFEPALSIGGAESIEHVGVGRADVHLNMLFQMRG